MTGPPRRRIVAKKTVKKVTRRTGLIKVTCPCCNTSFDTSAMAIKCPDSDCGAKINIYENEAAADAALESLENAIIGR
jgi:hypothetical protein